MKGGFVNNLIITCIPCVVSRVLFSRWRVCVFNMYTNAIFVQGLKLYLG